MGTSWPKLFACSGGMVEGISGVQIGPGATQFTRMPRSAIAWPRLAVKLAIAALVAEYAISLGGALSEFTEVVFTMAEPGFMCGSAALHRKNMGWMLTLKVCSHSSSGVSSSEVRVIWKAALLTRMSS